MRRGVGVLIGCLATLACGDDERDLSGRIYELVSIDGDPVPAPFTDPFGEVENILIAEIHFAIGDRYFEMGEAEVATGAGVDTLPLIGSGHYEIDGTRITLDRGADLEHRFEHGTIEDDVITIDRADQALRYEFAREGIPGENF